MKRWIKVGLTICNSFHSRAEFSWVCPAAAGTKSVESLSNSTNLPLTSRKILKGVLKHISSFKPGFLGGVDTRQLGSTEGKGSE